MVSYARATAYDLQSNKIENSENKSEKRRKTNTPRKIPLLEVKEVKDFYLAKEDSVQAKKNWAEAFIQDLEDTQAQAISNNFLMMISNPAESAALTVRHKCIVELIKDAIFGALLKGERILLGANRYAIKFEEQFALFLKILVYLPLAAKGLFMDNSNISNYLLGKDVITSQDNKCFNIK